MLEIQPVCELQRLGWLEDSASEVSVHACVTPTTNLSRRFVVEQEESTEWLSVVHESGGSGFG